MNSKTSGSKNRTLMKRRDAAVPRGVAHATTAFADRAENSEIWDVDGNHFVDFAGGIAVLNTGHRHPAVLAAIEAQGLLGRAGQIGQRMMTFIKALIGRSDMPSIAALRGLGAMVAFELTNAAGEPDTALTKRVTGAALESGLVMLSCGVYSNVIRLLVPLTVSDEVLAVGLQRLETALVAAHQR